MNKDNNIDKNRLLNAIVNAQGTKINKNAVERAKSGDVSGLLGSLDKENREKLESALADKNKAREILASKEAKEIMKKFLGGKHNG